MSQSSPIQQLGAEVLRQTALAVEDFTASELVTLLNELMQHMQAENGVGIAAPQLGVSLQVLVVASRPTPRYPNAPTMSPLVMINPRYQVLDETLIKDWEGCLSVPGIRALVPRYPSVLVDFQDRDGQSQQIRFDDFPARVFQHEYDHLIGLVYLDRVESNRDIVAESEFYKRIKPVGAAA